MVALAQNLAVPGLGDVEFTCHDGKGQVKLLHAITPILTERCEYYAKSFLCYIDNTNEYFSVCLRPKYSHSRGTFKRRQREQSRFQSTSQKDHRRGLRSTA